MRNLGGIGVRNLPRVTWLIRLAFIPRLRGSRAQVLTTLLFSVDPQKVSNLCGWGVLAIILLPLTGSKEEVAASIPSMSVSRPHLHCPATPCVPGWGQHRVSV